MRILRMTMSPSQIQKKNNFQPEDQISTVYKNSSFQPEHYFLGRGFFILIILFFQPVIEISYISNVLIFNHLLRLAHFSCYGECGVLCQLETCDRDTGARKSGCVYSRMGRMAEQCRSTLEEMHPL